MLYRFQWIVGNISQIKIAIVLISLLFVTGAKGDDVIENEVEDINTLISQVIGGQPNILILTLNSAASADVKTSRSFMSPPFAIGRLELPPVPLTITPTSLKGVLIN